MLGYIASLNERCSDTDDLLLQLKTTEDWRSVLQHNTFASQIFLDKYMERNHWEDLRTNILNSIAECCFISNSSKNVSSNKAAACSKKYNAHRIKNIKHFASRAPPAIGNVDQLRQLVIEWKSTLWSLALKYTTIVHKNLPNGSLTKALTDTLAYIDLNNTVPEKDSLLAPVLYYISGKSLNYFCIIMVTSLTNINDI